MAVSQLTSVFKLDKKGFNLRRGVSLLVVMLAVLIVTYALDKERYFLSVAFGVLFAGLSDPGGEYAYRVPRIAVVGVIGAGLTALGFGIGDRGWGWVVLAVFAVTLLAGLAVKYGLHRFVAGMLLNIWFLIALALPAGYRLDHIHTSAWAQALAWLIGSALALVYVTVVWLARGRTAQPQPGAARRSRSPVPTCCPAAPSRFR